MYTLMLLCWKKNKLTKIPYFYDLVPFAKLRHSKSFEICLKFQLSLNLISYNYCWTAENVRWKLQNWNDDRHSTKPLYNLFSFNTDAKWSNLLFHESREMISKRFYSVEYSAALHPHRISLIILKYSLEKQKI